MLLVAAWLVVGFALAFWLARRGHSFPVWWGLFMVLGPLIIPAAIVVDREDRRRERARLATASGSGVASPARATLAVLAGVDGTAESLACLRAALDLLGPRADALTLVYVTDFETRPDAAAEAVLREAAQAAGRDHPELDVRTVAARGKPADVLRTLAEGGGFDVVVVGRARRDAATRLLGSTTTELLRRPLPASVLISDRPDPR